MGTTGLGTTARARDTGITSRMSTHTIAAGTTERLAWLKRQGLVGR